MWGKKKKAEVPETQEQMLSRLEREMTNLKHRVTVLEQEWDAAKDRTQALSSTLWLHYTRVPNDDWRILEERLREEREEESRLFVEFQGAKKDFEGHMYDYRKMVMTNPRETARLRYITWL